MKEQISKEWSLVLFRKVENFHFEDIENAKFRFGRTQDEVLENEGEKMSEGLISIVKSKNLQEEVMETGFVINFTTVNPKNAEYILLDKILSSPPTFRKYGYSLYANKEKGHPLRFVDLGRISDYSLMPNKIWIKLRPLTINEISWGIENNMFENLNDKQLEGEQMSLEDFGLDIRNKIKEKVMITNFDPELPFPGPSEFKYKFLK